MPKIDKATTKYPRLFFGFLFYPAVTFRCRSVTLMDASPAENSFEGLKKEADERLLIELRRRPRLALPSFPKSL